MNKQNIIFLGVGSCIGFLASTVFWKLQLNKVEEVHKQQIKELEEYYGSKDEFRRMSDEEKKAQDESYTENKSTKEINEAAIRAHEWGEKMAKRYDENGDLKPGYNKLYSEKKNGEDKPEKDPAELEHPEDDEEDEEAPGLLDDGTERDPDVYPEDMLGPGEEPIEQPKHPYEVYEDDIPDLVIGEESSLLYYKENQTLVNEDTYEEVHDEGEWVGTVLEDSGFTSNEETRIIVYNPAYSRLIYVNKVFDAFMG